MKNGKILILYMTPFGFLTELWRNLFKEPKVLEDSKTLYDLHRKGEHWAWESLDGIRTYKRKVFLSRVYLHSLKLGRFFRKSKLKVKEPLEHLLKFMANLFGVLVLACVILIFVLSLLLSVIVSYPVMLVLGLSRGRQTYLLSSLLKEPLLEKIQHLKKF